MEQLREERVQYAVSPPQQPAPAPGPGLGRRVSRVESLRRLILGHADPGRRLFDRKKHRRVSIFSYLTMNSFHDIFHSAWKAHLIFRKSARKEILI